MNHAILKKLGFNPIDKVNTKEKKNIKSNK